RQQVTGEKPKTKILKIGWQGPAEKFEKDRQQGNRVGESYIRSRGVVVPRDLSKRKGPGLVLIECPTEIVRAPIVPGAHQPVDIGGQQGPKSIMELIEYDHGSGCQGPVDPVLCPMAGHGNFQIAVSVLPNLKSNTGSATRETGMSHLFQNRI